MDSSSEGEVELRRRIRDLAALTALPALWIGRAPAAIVDSVSETLLATLDAALVSVHFTSGASTGWIETVRVDSKAVGEPPPPGWLDLLHAQLGPKPSHGIASLCIPSIDRVLTAFIIPLGYQDITGHIIVASQQANFPSPTEAMLCQVAANQAAIALQEAVIMRQLRDALAVLQAITDTATSCLYLQDDAGRCTFMNPAGERALGYSFDELRGKVLHDIIHCRHADGSPYPHEECRFNVTLTRREPVNAAEDVLVRKDGSLMPVLCAASPIIQDGVPVGTLIEAHDITDLKKVEQDLLVKANREILLGRIGVAIRSSLVPEEIEATAAQLLGQALGSDRCFFVHVDLVEKSLRPREGWHRADLAPVSGECKTSEFGDNFEATFSGGTTLVVHDVEEKGWSPEAVSALSSLQIRSFIATPLHRAEKLLGLLCAAAERERIWEPEEIALTEAVAALTKTAIEAANIVQREHRIATALQEALLLPPSEHLTCLDIAPHYQAALEESSVGGDFYAVYPLRENETALIIGDVSGKGLAAACQVSTVQNMLRYALCARDSVSAAVTEMNAIVTAQNLLDGFATLFVGVYNNVSRTLSYASCGHEPSLIRRISGEIEHLDSCGPPLGVAEDAEYPERLVRFDIGDAFILYTDGLSEAGIDRRNLLGVSGVASIVQRIASNDAASLVRQVVEEVRAYGQGGFRDDVCVVGAVVKE